LEDEIIECNGTNYSLRKILGEDGWAKYLNMSDKAQGVARLMVHMDLAQMEIGFARLDEKFKKLKED